MKRILCLFFFLSLLLPVFGQADYISYSRSEEDDRIEDLGDKAGILLLCKNNDLVVNVPNLKDGVSPVVEYKGERPDGYHEYIVLIPKDETRTPKIEASRRGVVFKVEFTARIKPDFLVAYRLDEVPHPIRLDDQTKGNDVHTNPAEAAVEFATVIKDMKIVCHPDLKAKVVTTPSKADPNIKVTMVTFPIAALKAAKEKVMSLHNEAIELEKFLNDKNNSKSATDAQWDRLEVLEGQEAKANVYCKTLSNIVITVEGSNNLSINVMDFGPRQKASYVVVPLIIEKTKFITECSSYMSQGAELFKARKYKDARQAYLNALNAKDVVVGMRSTIKASIAQCDSCIMYDAYASTAINKMKELRKDPTATQDEVAKYATAAIDFAKILSNYNPDPLYGKIISKMESIMENMPLKVKFTVVQWKTLEEGNPIAGIEVWAYKGVSPDLEKKLTSDRKFNKMKDKEGYNLKQIAITDANGVAEIELNRSELPAGLIFRPVDGSGVKFKYLSMKELFNHARGTYFEKQFRLRLFTKVD